MMAPKMSTRRKAKQATTLPDTASTDAISDQDSPRSEKPGDGKVKTFTKKPERPKARSGKSKAVEFRSRSTKAKEDKPRTKYEKETAVREHIGAGKDPLLREAIGGIYVVIQGRTKPRSVWMRFGDVRKCMLQMKSAEAQSFLHRLVTMICDVHMEGMKEIAADDSHLELIRVKFGHIKKSLLAQGSHE